MPVFTSAQMLGTFLRERLQDALSAAEGLPNGAIAPGHLDELTANICGTYSVERLVVLPTDMTLISTIPETVGTRDPSGEVIRSRQLIATYRLPYTGLTELWHKVPNGELNVIATKDPLGAFDVGGPDHLLIKFRVTNMRPDQITNTREQLLSSLKTKVGWSNNQVDNFNETLQRAVRGSLKQRLDLIEQGQALTSASDLPLYRAPSDQQVPISVERKRLRPDPITSATSSGTTDPVMAKDIYDDVVQTIEHMTRAMELTPTAAKLDEEEIRNLILFVLNANYRGAAAGEVFNGEGKTDILLRWNDGNAFIGECKFWRGRVAFVAAVNQLHRYATWRDTKVALIVFIRNGSPTQIMAKARQELRDHVTFADELPGATETRSDFILRSTSDPDRMISVALVGVVIPPRARPES